MNHKFFEEIKLDSESSIYYAQWVNEFNLDHSEFKKIWDMHPEEYHKVKMYGKEIPTPRWQQSYGKNYSYSGSKNNALPIPKEFEMFLNWSSENIDDRLNGLLLNWYDGKKKHYIGAHRDDTNDLHKDSPVVTISLGQDRKFRMRPYQGKGYKDITMYNSTVIVVPWETNLRWTHEVPHFAKNNGKRISVTLRAYL